MAKSKRRGDGEGHIRQRADGRWEARLSLGYAGGRRRCKSVFGRIQAEALEKLDTEKAKLRAGLPVTTEPQSLAAFLERWLAETLATRAKPRSLDSFSTIARLHITPVIGRVRLDKLTPQHVAGLLNARRSLAPQTRVNILTVLKSALAEALRWNLVARNVATLVDAPRIPRPQVRALDTDGARKLLQAAQGHRFEAIIALAVMLGMRRGEILGLRWADVSFEERTLHVHQAVQRIGRTVQATEVKTDRSRRTLALPDNVIRTLRLRRAQQAQERLLAGGQWQDQDLVFTGPNGAPLEPVTLNRSYKALLKTAGLPVATRFHDLRHSAASLLLAQGVHARVIMELLGHSSISVTMNTYGHIMPAALREAASTMDAILAAEK